MSRSLSSSRSKPYDRPSASQRQDDAAARQTGSSFFGNVFRKLNPFAAASASSVAFVDKQIQGNGSNSMQQDPKDEEERVEKKSANLTRPRQRGNTPHTALNITSNHEIPRHHSTILDSQQNFSGSSNASSVFGHNQSMLRANPSASPARAMFDRNSSPFRSPSLSALNLHASGSTSPTESLFAHGQRNTPGRSLFPASPSLSTLTGRKRTIDQITSNSEHSHFSPPSSRRGHSPLNPSYAASAISQPTNRLPYSPAARQRHRQLGRDSSVASFASFQSHASSTHSIDSSGRPRKKQMVWDPTKGFIATDELERRNQAETVPQAPRNEAERILSELESMRGARAGLLLSSPRHSETGLPHSLSLHSLRQPGPSLTYNFGSEAPVSPQARKNLYNAQKQRETRLSPLFIEQDLLSDGRRASTSREPVEKPAKKTSSRRKRDAEATDEDSPKKNEREESPGKGKSSRKTKTKVISPSVSGMDEDQAPLRRSTRQAEKRVRQESEEPLASARSPEKTKSSKSSNSKSRSSKGSPSKSKSKGKGKAPDVIEEESDENAMDVESEEKQKAPAETQTVSRPPQSASRALQSPARSKMQVPASPSKVDSTKLIESVVMPLRKPKLTGDEEKMLARSSKRSARGMFGATAEDLQIDDELGATDNDGLERIQMPEFKLPNNFKFSAVSTGPSSSATSPLPVPVSEEEDKQPTPAAAIPTTSSISIQPPTFSFAPAKVDSPVDEVPGIEAPKKMPTFSFAPNSDAPSKGPPASVAPSFSFTPAPPASVEKPDAAKASPFSFGPSKATEPKAEPVTVKSPFSFGAPPKTDPVASNETAKPLPAASSSTTSASPFAFGMPPTSTKSETETATASTSSPFSFSTAAPPAPAKENNVFPSSSKPPAFSFTPSTPDLNAESTKPADAAVVSAPAFSFGKPAESSPATNNAFGVFGAKLTPANKSEEAAPPTKSPFSFGASPFDNPSSSAAPESSPKSPFSFGNAAAPENPADKPAFSFGPAPPAFSAATSGFPTSTAPTNGFGAAPVTGFPVTSPSASPSPSPFGAAASPFTFGANTAASAPAFGSAATFGNTPSAFGSQPPSPFKTGGFGTQSPAMTPSASAESGVSASPFAFNASPQPAQPASGFSFGQPSVAAAPFAFGSTSAPQSTGFQFGAATDATAQSAGFGFGQSPMPSPGLASPNGSLFNVGSGGGDAPRPGTGRRPIKRLPTARRS